MTRDQVLNLYKSIRRLHRQLPPGLQFLGNSYLRDEFARHRQVDAAYIPAFVQAWTAYRDTLRDQLTQNQGLGTSLASKDLDALSNEQLGQLHALKSVTEEDASKKPEK